MKRVDIIYLTFVLFFRQATQAFCVTYRLVLLLVEEGGSEVRPGRRDGCRELMVSRTRGALSAELRTRRG